MNQYGPGQWGPNPFGAQQPIAYRAVRRRMKVPLIGGIVMLTVGVIGLAVGIVLLVRAAGDLLDDRVAEGTVPSRSVSFDATDGPYTIVLLTSTFDNDVEVERQVGDTVCIADLADGTTATVRGGRQATAVSTDGGSTVGWFTAVEGTTRVSCTYEQSRSERDFAVVVGKPPGMLMGFAPVFGAIAVGLAGIFAVIIGARGRVVLLQ